VAAELALASHLEHVAFENPEELALIASQLSGHDGLVETTRSVGLVRPRGLTHSTMPSSRHLPHHCLTS
jgi:hypothetical protein